MDDLDAAALHRIDEVSQALYRPSNVSGLQDRLAQAAIATLGAAGHTAQVKKLNEEGMLILATIRILNRLFIDAMEDKVNSGSEDFSNRLIAISKMATLPNEDRRILELYIALAYGGPGEERIMPFECAKREGIFKQRIEKIEHEINT